MRFACAAGHVVVAMQQRGGDWIDLTGHYCPVCLGTIIIGPNEIGPPALLAPEQEPSLTFLDTGIDV